MPLNSPVSYYPTLSEFVLHWRQTNDLLSSPVVLPTGTLADAEALQAELEQVLAQLRTARLTTQLARATQQEARVELRQRLEQFSDMVRIYWQGMAWADLAPLLPPTGAVLDKFLAPCRDGLRLWNLLDAGAPPAGLTLPLKLGPAQDFTRADYAALVEAPRLKALEVEDAEFAAALLRAQRDALHRRVRDLLLSYVRTLNARLPKRHPSLTSMPRLWPLPGHTPAPVKLAGLWDVEKQLARLSWEPSKDSKLSHYELRLCPGLEYQREDEALLAKIPPTAPLLVETQEELGQPGSAASFRLYVVLTTGNERASRTVTIER